MTPLNQYLDAAILQPHYTSREVRQAINECLGHAVRAVCVRPADIALAIEMCRGSTTDVSAVLAFPHGIAPESIKTAEARQYVDLGVAEIDMVVNYSLILDGDWAAVRRDIRAVTSVAQPAGVIVKAILETCYLDDDQIRQATTIAIEAEADYVKTSTGFADGGATEQAVRAMLDTAAGRIKVKASGGIRDSARARLFLQMGCQRLGVGHTALAGLLGDAPVNTRTDAGADRY